MMPLRQRFLFLSVLALAWTMPAIAGDITIMDLRRDGWVVIDQRDEVTKLDPLAHYDQTRHARLTSYFLLEKEGTRMQCWLSYDNHLDKIEQDCVPAD